MPTEVQIYKDATIIPADLSTGGPSWDTSGNVSISVSGGKFKGPLEGNVTGNATGLSDSPNVTVGTVTATSFKTSTTSTGFLKADGTVDTNTYITQAVPVGSVFHFAASTAPTGYLKANGNDIPNGNGTVQGITANFSALYAILGSTYGAPGRLPDLRGEFIRGWVDNRVGIDTGTTFGRFQDWSIENITSADTGARRTDYDPAPTGPSYHVHAASGLGGGGVPYQPIAFDASRQVKTSTETRPRNVALLACIKY